MHRALTAMGNPPKLKCHSQKGAAQFYDQLMLGCEKRILEERVTSCQVIFQQGKPICSSHLGETPYYHILSIKEWRCYNCSVCSNAQ